MRLFSANWSASAAIVLLLVFNAGPSLVAGAKSDLRDRFFTNGTVARIRIKLDEEALKALREEPRKYVRARVEEGGATWSDVGIHLKGALGSYQPLEKKPSLTLNFDKFVEDQKFHGLDKLYLNNSAQDPTYLHELLGSTLFRAAGYPAARVTHARVELNGRDLGLYVLVEGFDRSFLKRHFANPDGNFYDSGYLADVSESLEKTCGKGLDDGSDLKRLAAAAAETNAAVRLKRLAEVLDMERFHTFLALEILGSHWDGYSLHKNNYRLYHDPGQKKFVFIPCGMDQLLLQPASPVLGHCLGMVAHGVLATPEGRMRHFQTCSMLMTNIFTRERMTAAVNGAQHRVRNALREVNPALAETHDRAVEDLLGRMTRRLAHVRAELNSEPQPFPDAVETTNLSGWRPCVDLGTAQLSEISDPVPVLTIDCSACRSQNMASWRTRVSLPAGRYRFDGVARTAAVVPLQGAMNRGVTLRVYGRNHSGSTRASEDGSCQTLRIEFSLSQAETVELICDARLFSGIVSFEKGSLRVTRLN